MNIIWIFSWSNIFPKFGKFSRIKIGGNSPDWERRSKIEILILFFLISKIAYFCEKIYFRPTWIRNIISIFDVKLEHVEIQAIMNGLCGNLIWRTRWYSRFFNIRKNIQGPSSDGLSLLTILFLGIMNESPRLGNDLIK